MFSTFRNSSVLKKPFIGSICSSIWFFNNINGLLTRNPSLYLDSSRNCTKEKKEWKLVAHKKKLRKSKKRGSTIGLLQNGVFQLWIF